MAKRNRSMTSAGNAQQVVEVGEQDRFQKAAGLANSAPDTENFDSTEVPTVKRPMSSRKTAQVTCTMDHADREYLKKLALRLSNDSGEMVTISGALRYLIEKARELNL